MVAVCTSCFKFVHCENDTRWDNIQVGKLIGQLSITLCDPVMNFTPDSDVNLSRQATTNTNASKSRRCVQSTHRALSYLDETSRLSWRLHNCR